MHVFVSSVSEIKVYIYIMLFHSNVIILFFLINTAPGVHYHYYIITIIQLFVSQLSLLPDNNDVVLPLYKVMVKN